MTLEYLTLGVYFVGLLFLGGLFAKFNTNLSDFVRGGGKGTWWILGGSMLMSGISAFTFTGNGSAAYEAGPTFLVIYLANTLGFLCGGLFLGPWYRQTRAYTGADVIRSRFGTSAEQFSAYVGVLLGPISSAIQLWALGIFVSSVFGFPLVPTVFFSGLIVVAYSVSGGSWAVMATDFVQAVVLMGITTILAVLSFVAIGGVSGFMEAVAVPDVAASFTWIKAPGEFPGDRFTWQWCIVIFFMQLLNQINLGTAGRYLAAKDGREATRAAFFAMVMMALGSVIWFLPAMVARFLYADVVMALPMKDPATAAYSVIARELLPNGLLGVLIAGMFSATMSSIDSGLNGQTSTIMRNIVPRMRGVLDLPELDDRTNLRWCRMSSSIIGAVIIMFSLILVTLGDVQLFEVFLIVGSVIGLPMTMPLIFGLVLKRLPSWSYFFIFCAGMLPSAYSLIMEKTGGEAWTVQQRSLWVMGFGVSASLICWFFRAHTNDKFRENEAAFFKRMHTPVNFAEEIGEGNDAQQASLIGRIVLGMGLLMSLFLAVPNTMTDRLIILALAGFIFTVGLLLCWSGRKKERPETEAS
ncbi:hypothetical protein P3T73_00570 [Kiritimatiellota bacterium B12222]|nr:hypothetical protein P3T73_00570 [Kiritimatiellota bacterium B12222]